MSNPNNANANKVVDAEDLISKCELHAQKLQNLLATNKKVTSNNVRAATTYLREVSPVYLTQSRVALQTVEHILDTVNKINDTNVVNEDEKAKLTKIVDDLVRAVMKYPGLRSIQVPSKEVTPDQQEKKATCTCAASAKSFINKFGHDDKVEEVLFHSASCGMACEVNQLGPPNVTSPTVKAEAVKPSQTGVTDRTSLSLNPPQSKLAEINEPDVERSERTDAAEKLSNSAATGRTANSDVTPVPTQPNDICEINLIGAHHTVADDDKPERGTYGTEMQSDDKTSRVNTFSKEVIREVETLGPHVQWRVERKRVDRTQDKVQKSKVCEINKLGGHRFETTSEKRERSPYSSGMASDEKSEKCNQASPDKVICDINQIGLPQNGMVSSSAQRSDYTSRMASNEKTLKCNLEIPETEEAQNKIKKRGLHRVKSIVVSNEKSYGPEVRKREKDGKCNDDLRPDQVICEINKLGPHRLESDQEKRERQLYEPTMNANDRSERCNQFEPGKDTDGVKKADLDNQEKTCSTSPEEEFKMLDELLNTEIDVNAVNDLAETSKKTRQCSKKEQKPKKKRRTLSRNQRKSRSISKRLRDTRSWQDANWSQTEVALVKSDTEVNTEPSSFNTEDVAQIGFTQTRQLLVMSLGTVLLFVVLFTTLRAGAQSLSAPFDDCEAAGDLCQKTGQCCLSFCSRSFFSAFF